MIDFSKVKGMTIPEGVVKQITDASGRVLWRATISFTMNGETYEADRGMTWAEWFASDYNTTGETEGDIKDADGNAVSLDAVIVGGAAYEVEFNRFIPILECGSITFSYVSMFKYYRGTYTVDALPDNINAVNALMIDREIIPLPNATNSTTGVRNCIRSNTDNGMPTKDGDTTVSWAENPSSLPYTIIISFFNDVGTCNIAIGTI